MNQVTVHVQTSAGISSQIALVLGPAIGSVCGGVQPLAGCQNFLCMVDTTQESFAPDSPLPDPIIVLPSPGTVVPLCDTINCAKGCCDDPTSLCRAGTGDQLCGAKGEICRVCVPPSACQDQACRTNATLSPSLVGR